MTSTVAVLVVDAVDPELVARFWCGVLGYQVVEREEELLTIAGPDPKGLRLDVIRVPEAKRVKNRLHLDLRADGTSTAQELDRLLSLGARRVDVGQPDDATWVVLADPEDNEFCLLSRTAQEVQALG